MNDNNSGSPLIISETNTGEWIKDKLKEVGATNEMIATVLERGESTIFRWTKDSSLDIKKVKLIADVIKVDLRDYFEDVEFLYGSQKTFKQKYYDLLEEHKELTQKYIELLQSSND